MAKGDKYRELGNYLVKSNKETVTLTFTEIENIIGDSLPPSAYNHLAWWSNNLDHSQAVAWLEVGYETDFVSDTQEVEKIVFVKQAK